MTDLPKSVAIVSNSDERLYQFRAPIMRALLDNGIRVYAIAPPGRFVEEIESLGVEFVPWRLDRRSVNPISEVISLVRLVRIYRRLKPDVVQHFTIKPNLYGAIAARLSGVTVVVGGVTGLGYAFAQDSRRRVLRSFAALLYRMSAALSDRLIFQTAHDADLLFGASGAFRSKALVVPGGSSVDLAVFSPDSVNPKDQDEMRASLGIPANALVVTMASRLLYDKGVLEFVETARTIRAKREDTVFIMAGAADPANPDSVTNEDLNEWAESGDVLIAGHVSDMPRLLSISDIVVLPTYYPEGIPRVLIEAAAMRKPIVSTTIPGVAEIVEDGANGILVPPRDAPSLVSAIQELLDNPKTRSNYGAAGRLKAERDYDDKAVAERYLAEYRRLWAAKRLGAK